jgi:hypothetical protein
MNEVAIFQKAIQSGREVSFSDQQMC